MFIKFFSFVVYSRLKAFGKNGKIKLTEKLAILQYSVLFYRVNPSNAEATFVQSTWTQRFLQTI